MRGEKVDGPDAVHDLGFGSYHLAHQRDRLRVAQRGQVPRLDSFTEEALQDRDVLAIAAKIGYCVEPWPEFPNSFPGGLRLTLRDGRTVEWREPINRGHPDNPMQEAEIQDKFRANAARALPSDRIEAIIGLVDHLEDLSRVSELMDLCIVPSLS